ncbi:glycosyltransferase family 2 protein [Rhizosphaericola mali]|uniref:Glycosyltransferase n=1 Tax=Rhizosphaericola mali TaxID=2545455 RepID=A0A5P2GFV1_9BACT|nr:glycosyltransferase [Rhizosphaericola mali]QES90521.1 glycosyltransferase [Rhizosphaericola mali]
MNKTNTSQILNLENSDAIFWEPIRNLKDSAWAGHIPFAHWIMSIFHPNIFVELGTHSGVSYSAFCNSVKKNKFDTKCFAIDTWLGDSQAGLYSKDIFGELDEFNKNNFANFSTLIRSTFDDAVKSFDDDSIDLLHIDGFHSYDAVNHDFETWLPKMKENGIVILHDTNETQEGFGVWKFWKELENKYVNHFHFLHCHGLGIVYLGSELPFNLLSFFQNSEYDTELIRNIFSTVGGKYEKELQLILEQDNFQHINLEQKNQYEEKILSLENHFEDVKHYWEENEKEIIEEKNNQLQILKDSFKSELNGKTKEINSLYSNIWLFNTQVQSLEKDSLWRYLRKHPGLKRFLTKYIGYIRASLKGRLKQERKRYKRAQRHVPIIENSSFFDQDWYKRKYFDVVYSGFSPAMHYALFGKDGRLPSPLFNAQMYQDQYHDVKNSDFVPLVHYELHGKLENRYFQDCKDIDQSHIKIDALAQNTLVIEENRLYENWQEIIEKPHNEGLLQRLEVINDFDKKDANYVPLFSIIVPTYNTPKKLLEKCINSVLNQTFQNWELCIADDASTNKSTISTLKYFEKKDSRIKVDYRKENGHISAASNSALKFANGQFIVLLDHDDELVHTALQEVAMSISENPDAKIFYSDEDKYDRDGNRIHPYFKPDFSLDLLFSQNYICHLAVYQKKIIEKIGGFRVGFEGSQDYDLILRAVREVGDEKLIIHIPRILYHWRMTDSSTASSHENKPYAAIAGQKALQSYFDFDNSGVQVSMLTDGRYKTSWPIPNPSPLISLIIGTRDGYEELKTCIDSILIKTKYPNFEIIIVDNQSTDKETLQYFDALRSNPKISVISYNDHFNYSAINNLGVQSAKGDIIGLLNNDIEILNEDWLSEMVSLCLRKDIGCVGAKLLYPDGTIQHAGVVLGLGGIAGHPHKFNRSDAEGYFRLLKIVHNVSAVTGAALLVKKEIFLEVGGLDEKDLKVAFNDVDFCIKVREAGYRNIWTPFATIRHHESKSRGEDNTPEKYDRFMNEIEVMKKRWGHLLFRDPYYNPNLSLENQGYTIIIS